MVVPTSIKIPFSATIDCLSNNATNPLILELTMIVSIEMSGTSCIYKAPSSLEHSPTISPPIVSPSYSTNSPLILQVPFLRPILGQVEHPIITTLTLPGMTLEITMWYMTYYENPIKPYMHMVLDYTKPPSPSPPSNHSPHEPPSPSPMTTR